ncbi:LysR family transcriptional regulator [Roseomonas stagni]|uniref:LysR family transcriptional regulator n=1 Tax=Falsiroseomonas algicola TaxID=2716930 RepID=A0A6M1LRD1_9PROT|nr:LysR family transcriptional regulator [Falsiroseomonas algicola]NGM22214.1 LysR family transcriptional regulator [Falsiroseomonas algicola]
MHAASLNYFRETARRGSIRRAAAALNVSASALNRQILILEEELGTALFDRLPGGMRLTAAGELLLQHVVGTLVEFDRVRSRIDDLRAARTGHVGIAAVDSLLVDFLPRALDRFRADFPAVTYALDAANPAEVPRLVADGSYDLGFTFVGPTPPSLRFEHEVPAPIGVVMPFDHPLRQKREVSFDDVAPYPFLAQAGPLPRSADVDAGFARFRSGLRPRLVSNSIQALKTAIRLNMGIAFFTRLGFLEEIERGEVAWRPFDSPAINALRIGLLVPASRAPTAPARQLAARLVEEMGRLDTI